MFKYIAAGLTLLTSAQVGAQTPQISIHGSDQTQTITCQRDALLITGERNTATIQGHCAQIRVEGADNTVTFTQADQLIVHGARHHASGGTVHALDVDGKDSTLELTLRQPDGGSQASIQGAGHRAKLQIASQAEITLKGADNTLHWRRVADAPDPAITQHGARNRITAD